MEHTSEAHDRQNDRLKTVPNGHRPLTDRRDDGRDRQDDRPEPSSTVTRVTVPEAAEILGTTTDAVRSRMRRGKLRREEGEDGTVYVILEGREADHGVDSRETVGGARETVEDRRGTVESTAGDGRQTVEDGLVEVLSDQVSYLREQLDKEREANRENRRLLAAALERIPELEAPRDATPETRDAPETASDGLGKGAGRGEERSPQQGSWWRRFFGFDEPRP